MLTIKDFKQDLAKNITVVTYQDEQGKTFDTTYNGIVERRRLERIFQGGFI